MKTYYVTIDCQGQTELVVQVEATNSKDAKSKAMEAYLASKDISVVDEDVARSCCEDGAILVDEDGDELDFDEAFEVDEEDED